MSDQAALQEESMGVSAVRCWSPDTVVSFDWSVASVQPVENSSSIHEPHDVSSAALSTLTEARGRHLFSDFARDDHAADRVNRSAARRFAHAAP